MKWGNKKCRNTRIQAMKILAKKRIGRGRLVNQLEKLSDKKESLNLYKNRSDIKKTIKELERREEIPVEYSNGMLERKDIMVKAK